MDKPVTRKAMIVVSVVGLVASIVLCIAGLKLGIFTSQDKLQDYISQAGPAGAILFIVFQIVQVVIPIMPGAVSCLAGVVMYGAVKGFIYNYIGICVGSVLVFLIAKNLGRPVLYALFSEKTICRYDGWTAENNRFTKLFAIAIFLPVAPDDFLCYLAGTTKMRLGTFVAIILAGKPLAIALYSYGLNFIFTQLGRLVGGAM